MNKIAMTAALSVAGLWVATASAQAQSACEVYHVKRGDTLRSIAIQAYGHDDFQEIHEENRAAIGANPDLIVVGAALRLPCHEGDNPKPEDTNAAEVADDVIVIETVDETGADEVVVNVNKVINFVTANDYPPYTDESLPGQGIITTLVKRAMLRGEPEQHFTVVFVNDWAAHLEVLLPSMTFDASFPWVRPNCETRQDLTPLEFNSCQQYIYSEPLYEIVDGFFSRSGSGYDTITHYVEFEGISLCRPEGYSTSHLTELGLMPPAINLVQPASANQCFDLLMSGDVEAVSLDTRTGARILEERGLTDLVSENPALSTVLPLKVAVHSENPVAEELIETLNRGLREIVASGEWHAMISEALYDEIKNQVGTPTN